MGLDLLELFLELEQTFAVDLWARGDVDQLVTVGSVYQRICEEVVGRATADCASQRLFGEVRRALQAAWGVPRPAVRPKVLLRALAPNQRLARHWPLLEAHLSLRLPRWRLPRRGASTVADLVFALAPRRIGHLDARAWDRGEVWPVFVGVCCYRLDLSPDDLRRDARWNADLGIC